MKLSTLLPVVILVSLNCCSTAEADPLRIAASIYPITMLVEEIGGDKVAVTTIIPPGVDPHHFEISPSSMRAVYESDAIFLVGADFDSHLVGAEPLDTQIRVEFSESLLDSLIELGHTFNPHFWLDPVLAGQMGELIGLALIAADHDNHSYYEKRMARFADRVDSLHADVGGRLAASGFEAFVSFHPAWTYFARRYGLAEVGVVEKYPEHEPSARWVASLILEMERHDVQVIIIEEASDPGVVSSLAKDTGVKVLLLDPIGDPEEAGRSDFFGLVGHNVDLIEQAVKKD